MGTGQQWAYGPETTLKLLVQALAIAPTHSSKSIFQKFWALTPSLTIPTKLCYNSF